MGGICNDLIWEHKIFDIQIKQVGDLKENKFSTHVELNAITKMITL